MSNSRIAIKKRYTKNYYKINRNIACLVGFCEAGFFDVLVDYEQYLIEEQQIKERGAFFVSTDALTKLTNGFTYKQHWRIFKILEERGLVELDTKGIPPKRFITIRWEVVDEVVAATPQQIELFVEEIAKSIGEKVIPDKLSLIRSCKEKIPNIPTHAVKQRRNKVAFEEDILHEQS